MHKASLTALTAGLEQRLRGDGICSRVRIVDMQTLGRQKEKYGEIDFGGLLLEKYRVGCPFGAVSNSLKETDVVGINANFTSSRKIASDFAKYARRSKKDSLIVVGGADATADPDYYLQNGADVVVKGEGELTFQRVIQAFNQRKDFRGIANISYFAGGTIKHNPNTFLQDPLEINSLLPPNLEIVDLAKYTDTGEGEPPFGLRGPFISVETSRGCAQACSFCAGPTTKGKYRFMKLENIKKHFEYFQRKKIRTLLFQEDNLLSRIHRKPDGKYLFPDGRKELLGIFRLARGMGFSWEFTNGLEFGQYEYGGKIDYELIQTMFWHELEDGKIKGCYRAQIPLENLTDEGPTIFRKLKPFKKNKEIIKALANSGVKMLTFNLIIGRPEDDQETLRLYYRRCGEIRELINNVGKGTVIYFNVFNLSLLPGTGDYKKYQDLLVFDLKKDPEVVSVYLGSLKTKHFTPWEITQARGALTKMLNGDRLIGDYDETDSITSKKFEKVFLQ